MTGTALIGGGTVGNNGANWHVVATGDFYGTGKSDLVWQSDDGTVAIWDMDGTKLVGGGTVGNFGPSWHIRATGDFNGDGLFDLDDVGTKIGEIRRQHIARDQAG